MRLCCLGVFSMTLVACEHGVTLQVDVEIPVDVQQEISAQMPARVLIEADIPKTGSIDYSLGVLCEVTEDPVVVTLDHDGFGCAKEGVIQAWIAPIGDETPAPECALIQEIFSTGAIPEDAPQASAVVFKGNTESNGCEDGEETLELVLEGT